MFYQVLLWIGLANKGLQKVSDATTIEVTSSKSPHEESNLRLSYSANQRYTMLFDAPPWCSESERPRFDSLW